MKFVTEQPCGFSPESTLRMAPSFPDASMPCSTRMTPRRASAQRRSWRSSSSSRSSSVRALSGVLVGEAEAVGRVTMGEVHRAPGLDPQALDHPGRVLGHSVTLVRRRARQLDPHRRSRARHCWTSGPSPPCATTMACTMARPRPAPPRWRERDTSAREKRSNARRDQLLGHARAVVVHLDDGAPAAVVDPHRHRRAGGRVHRAHSRRGCPAPVAAGPRRRRR